ncbi:MAG: MiaB/RimO family radical SAM methylthiotransferase [Anaerolineaceae bacterium]|jgi:threonylcarbamoyladenosine tRNA methylthiotransferase MtaB
MKIFLDMVGCRLNQAEIDMLAIDLARRGATIVPKAEKADKIIVNTCCVTKKACADSRKMIRHYRNTSDAEIISTGCWVNADLQEAQRISDLVFLNNDKAAIPESLLGDSSETDITLSEKPVLGKRTRTRGFVKVQDGCRNKCSFCLTTIARGESRSESVSEVVRRIHELEEMGVKEVVLTGVQLGSWGKDLQPESTLADLVREILAQTQMPRIRFSSIEPWDIELDLIEILNEERICSHLHIPLQSGANTVLRAMRRPNSAEKYFKVIETIRKIAPQTSITTDVISGFPNETPELFQESLEFIKKCNFDGGHVFSFSPMPGTDAALLPSSVQDIEIKQRTRILIEHFKEQTQKSKQEMVGKTSRVLYESKRKTKAGESWTGFTENFLRISCLATDDLMNKILETKITSVDPKGNLIGRVT